MKALALKKISDSLVRGKNEPPGAIFIHLFFSMTVGKSLLFKKADLKLTIFLYIVNVAFKVGKRYKHCQTRWPRKYKSFIDIKHTHFKLVKVVNGVMHINLL